MRISRGGGQWHKEQVGREEKYEIDEEIEPVWGRKKRKEERGKARQSEK